MLKFMLRPALVLALLAAPLAGAPLTGAAAAEKKAKPDPVVATIDGKPVRLSDLEAAKAQLPARARQMPTKSMYRPLLERVITQKLIVAAGRRARIQDDPLLKKRMAQVEDRLIHDIYIGKKVEKQVTDDAVNKRYAQFLKLRKGGTEVHARHILVKTEREAIAIIRQLRKGADFAKLAKQKSTGPTKVQGGDLGWFGKGDMVKEFDAVVFKLKSGQVSPKPVRTQYGWHVIKVVAKRTKSAPKLAAVRTQLIQTMAREFYQAEIKRLNKVAKVMRFGLDGKPLKAKAAPAPAGPKKPAPAGGTTKK
ncbi:MAG: peptidylprolyl isomerase [Alphaproteobacteria bacterium]